MSGLSSWRLNTLNCPNCIRTISIRDTVLRRYIPTYIRGCGNVQEEYTNQTKAQTLETAKERELVEAQATLALIRENENKQLSDEGRKVRLQALQASKV